MILTDRVRLFGFEFHTVGVKTEQVIRGLYLNGRVLIFTNGDDRHVKHGDLHGAPLHSDQASALSAYPHRTSSVHP